MANANDTFTVGTDTSLVDHTSDSGHTWTKDSGNVLTCNAAGDYLYNASPTNASRYSLGVTPASAEYDVQADIVSGVNWAMGLMARVVEASLDDYRCYFENGTWKLLKRDAGTVTQLGTYTGDSPNGTTRTVKLEIRDATKKVFIGGVERISSSDNAITVAGNPGLLCLGIDTSDQLDNWSSTDAASGHTVSVGQVTETDTAQTIASRKQLAISQVIETDTAQAISSLKRLLIGQVIETDTSMAIATKKALAVGQVVETDSAQALYRLKTLAVGQVLETDLAQAILINPIRRLLASVIETDIAHSIGTGSQTIVIGLASEADTAFSISVFVIDNPTFWHDWAAQNAITNIWAEQALPAGIWTEANNTSNIWSTTPGVQ